MVEKLRQLHLPNIPLLDPGTYTIAGHYSNRYTKEFGQVWLGFHGSFHAIQWGQQESLSLEGELSDLFDTAKLRGVVTDKIFHFTKTYGGRDSRRINYELEPAGESSWTGEYTLFKDAEFFTGAVRCVILPTIIHRNANFRIFVN